MMKFFPAVGCLVVAAFCAFGAMRTTRIDCDRTICTLNDRSFRVADVREVRFIDKVGKNGRAGESAIIFANGTEVRIGRDDTDDARTIHSTLAEFFSGTAPSLQLLWKGSRWLVVAAVVGLISALALGYRAYKAPRITSPNRAPKPAVKKPSFALIAGGVLLAVAGVLLAQLLVANKAHGTLELVCKQRCRFDGMECLPGGAMTMRLDAGTYSIDVWASSGSALWIPSTFSIAVGETTHFVCQ
jgi:hypothetical protein